jgi:photosystem II stability/assembly factor-like uncharacterized protein
MGAGKRPTDIARNRRIAGARERALAMKTHDNRKRNKGTSMERKAGRKRVTRARFGLTAMLAALIVSLALAGTAAAVWKSQTSPISDYQYGVKFFDASTGWSVGANGTIQATTNGGSSWSAQTSGTTRDLNGVDAVSAGTAWVVGDRGVILKTTNGGSSWSAQTSGTTRDLNGVDAVSAGTAWVVGDRGVILKTTNGGATWTPQTSGTTQLLLGVDFLDASVGYVVGDNGVVLKTADGGSTWTKQTSGITTSALAAVSFRDASNGIAVGDLMSGGNGRILRTSNGGSTWSIVTTNQPYTLYDVHNLDATHAWAVGDNGTILKSVDGGQTWTLKESSSHYSLDGVDFIDASTGWAVGSDDDGEPLYGTIRKTTDGGETWSTQTFNTLEYLYDVDGVSSGAAYAVGSAGVILKASNGGVADTITPVTTDDAPTVWVDHGVTVTLTPTDDDSGIVYTNYTLDGGAPQMGTSVSVLGDGTHHLSYYSVDLSGNVEATKQATIRVDTSKPATTDNAPAAWQKSAVTVALTAGDGSDSSGVATVSYRVDGGTLQTGTSVSVPAPAGGGNDGTHTVTYYATDAVGNVEDTKSCTVKIDTTAPALSDNAPTGWQGSDQTVHLTATDAASGVGAVTYSVDGAQTQTGTTVSVTGDGTHTVTYRAVDVAGNTATDKTATVKIDKTAPATTDNAPAAWSKSDVTVTLSGSDASSGVATTSYRIDGGAPQTGASVLVGAPANGSNDGTHTITYYSTDAVGNDESEKTATVRIDASAPSTTDNASAAWNKTAVTVTLSPNDGAGRSGVASTSYSVDGGAPQTGATVSIPAPADGSNDGAHIITYASLDVAGNQEAARTATVRIDATAPVTTDDAPADWKKSDVTVTLTPADGTNRSGVEDTTYTVDGGSQQTGTTVVIPATTGGLNDGVHTIAYSSRDEAGNAESSKTATVRIDTTAPAATHDAPAAWQTTPTTVTITPSDPGAGNASGVSTTEYKLDDGDWSTGTGVDVAAPAGGTNDGTHTVSYRVTDVAGNVSEIQSATVKIDASAPDVPADVAAHWVRLSGRNGKVSAAYTITEAQHGAPLDVTLTLKNTRGKLIDSWTYQNDGSGVPSAESPDTALPKDGYRLVVSVQDAAGNQATDTTLSTFVVR